MRQSSLNILLKFWFCFPQQAASQMVNNTSVWSHVISPAPLPIRSYPVDTYTLQWEDSHDSTVLSSVLYSRSSSRSSLAPSISEISHISTSSRSSLPHHPLPAEAPRFSTPRKQHPHQPSPSPLQPDFLSEDSDTDLNMDDLLDLSQLQHKLQDIRSMLGHSSGYYSRSAPESSDGSLASSGRSQGSLPTRPPCVGREDPQVAPTPAPLAPTQSAPCHPCNLSMASDATTFMQQPLVKCPVAPVKKSRRSLAKKLKHIGRSIQRRSHEGLGLITLAVLWGTII